jgi:hypothetical protein
MGRRARTNGGSPRKLSYVAKADIANKNVKPDVRKNFHGQSSIQLIGGCRAESHFKWRLRSRRPIRPFDSPPPHLPCALLPR